MSICLFVFLFVRIFLGHLETDWDTLWYKVAFCSGKGSEKIFLKNFFKELLLFFYISLRFLCKFQEES